MGLEFEQKKSRNASVSRTEFERQNQNGYTNNVPKMRNMTLTVEDDVKPPASPCSREEREENEESNVRPNPQCVESYQADIFDFCMKTEVIHPTFIDFFGALIFFRKI